MPSFFSDTMTFNAYANADHYVGQGFATDYYYGFETDRDSVIIGWGGMDILYAGGGDDTVWGGDGTDYLTGGSGDDWVGGGNDDDVIYTSTGHDTLDGQAGVDILVLTVEQSAGWSVNLQLGQGFQIVGQLFQPGTTVNTAEIANFENVEGSIADDVIIGDDSHNRLSDKGAPHDEIDNDRIEGGVGNDTILSFSGTDTLDGGDGEDMIVVSGDARNHKIYGGDDYDVFRFKDSADQSGLIATILDFDVFDCDQIELDPEFTFDPTGNGIGGQESFWISQDARYATVHVDRDGDQTEDYRIDVVMVQAGAQLLPEYDFIFA
ncbi:MAG: calcium-binding protein [Pseudomonadota bacterium]